MRLTEHRMATVFSMEDYSGCDCRLCKHRMDIRPPHDPGPPRCQFYHDGRFEDEQVCALCHGYEYTAEFDIS